MAEASNYFLYFIKLVYLDGKEEIVQETGITGVLAFDVLPVYVKYDIAFVSDFKTQNKIGSITYLVFNEDVTLTKELKKFKEDNK